MPAPARKTNEIMESLAALPRDVGPRDFLVMQVQREIDKLKKVDAPSAWMLQGILRASLYDLEGAKAAHELSVQLSPGDSGVMWNEVASLCALSRFVEARGKVGKMLAAGYIEPKYIQSALWLCLVTLETRQFLGLYSDYAGLIQEPNSKGVAEEMKQYADVIHAFVTDFPDTYRDLNCVYSHVQSTLEKFKESIVGFEAKVDNFYGQRVLHIEYWVESASAVVIGMNDALLDSMSTDESFEHWDSLIASFIHVEPESQQGKVAYADHA